MNICLIRRTSISIMIACIFGLTSLPIPSSYAASAGAGPSISKKKNRKAKRSSKGLSGQKGKTRGWHQVRGKCRDLQKRYIKASGHSAYAGTPKGLYQASICGAALNRGSTANAEAIALATCQKGLAKWKIGATNKCIIYMSK